MSPRKRGEYSSHVEKFGVVQPKKEAEKSFGRLGVWKKDVNIFKSFLGSLDENDKDVERECAHEIGKIDEMLLEIEYSVADLEKQRVDYKYEPRLSVEEKKHLEDIFIELFTVIGDRLVATNSLKLCFWFEQTMCEICEVYEMVYGVRL